MRVARLTVAALVAGAALGCSSAVAAAASPAGPAPAETPVEASYIVVLDTDPPSAPHTIGRLEREAGFRAQQRYVGTFAGFAATLSGAQVDRLSRHPAVDSIHVDAAVKLSTKKHDSADTVPFGVARIGAGQGGGHQGSADAAVAVLDTGLDLGNTDLDARAGVNCTKSGKAPQDDNGHGTHIGGTIGAKADGGGSVGVAPGTTLYAVKVLDNKAEGRISGLLCGMEWVHANAQRLNIKVANVSVTAARGEDGKCGEPTANIVHRTICASVAAGILYVAAAGNSGADLDQTMPAAFEEVLTVTATTDTNGQAGGLGPEACDPGQEDDTAATYSNFATTPAAESHLLAAPGTCVVSWGIGGRLATMTGTSMAAPHVAGAAVRCLSTAGVPGPCAGMAPRQIIDRLQRDAQIAAEDHLGYEGDPLRPLGDQGLRGYLVSTRNVG